MHLQPIFRYKSQKINLMNMVTFGGTFSCSFREQNFFREQIFVAYDTFENIN